MDQLHQHADGVWDLETDQSYNDAQTSSLYDVIASSDDLSSTNIDLLEDVDNWEEEFQLSPLRANLLRAFEWKQNARVLEIGCGAGAITRFLAEQGVQVDALEADRALAQLAALRTREFDQVRIIAELFHRLSFDADGYDAVVIAGMSDHACDLIGDPQLDADQALIELLQRCASLLTAQGKVFLAADNRHGVKYLFGGIDERATVQYYGFNHYTENDRQRIYSLSQWRALIEAAGIQLNHEYYVFPDFRFPRVLIGKQYSESSQYAFQHLEGIHSRDYYRPVEIGQTESLLYQAGVVNQHLGDFVNSFLFVLGKEQIADDQEVDFAHLPDFHRNLQYLALVTKQSGSDRVERQRLMSVKDIPENTGVSQDFSSEPYVNGLQLSVIWQRRLLSDPHGLDFEQYLLVYHDYLKKLESGVHEGFNIDALPNNIIVDENGTYHLFDREWQVDMPIDAAFVFYRGLVIFALKNAAALKIIIRLNYMTTLGDFIAFCFKTVGLNSAIEHIEQYHKRDVEFQSSISTRSQGYSLTDLLEPDIDEVELFPNILWRYENENYAESQQLFDHASTGHMFQKLYFELPISDKRLACFRFCPFDYRTKRDVGFFGVRQIKIDAVNTSSGIENPVLVLHDSNEVAKANIAGHVFYASKDADHLFMFSNRDVFLEFELPDIEMGDADRLKLTIEYRIVRSPDYQLAKYQFGSIQRVMEDTIKIKDHQMLMLKNEKDQLNKELMEIKRAKLWRMLVAYRDSFKISGYPEKNIFGKSVEFIKRLKKS